MRGFTSLLTVSPLSDGKSWWLRTPFGYDVGREGSGDSVELPVGFVTDFASIPRPLWILLPKWGRYGNAAVVHDFLTGSSCGRGARQTASFSKAWKCSPSAFRSATSSSRQCGRSGGFPGSTTGGTIAQESTASSTAASRRRRTSRGRDQECSATSCEGCLGPDRRSERAPQGAGADERRRSLGVAPFASHLRFLGV